MQHHKKKQRIAIVVLGDLGRSPRMLYHALSLQKAGLYVDLVGYLQSDLPHQFSHPDITTLPAMSFLLVQNPPSVPALIVAHYVAKFRSAKLVIDWHNLGHTILALRLSRTHLLVQMYKRLEMSFGRRAHAHIFVSHAMLNYLSSNWKLIGEKIVLHDLPPAQFKSLTTNEKHQVIESMMKQFPGLSEFKFGRDFLIVSSTSWTADEDFSILLDALIHLDAILYNAKQRSAVNTKKVYVIITGKGKLRAHYESKITLLDLSQIHIMTGWLTAKQYPQLLGSADIGVCLHTSSSKLDLPMKIVDMFGCSLPVCAYEYPCLSELVKPGFGRTFTSAHELTGILNLLLSDPKILVQMRTDISSYYTHHRWDTEWETQLMSLFTTRSEVENPVGNKLK